MMANEVTAMTIAELIGHNALLFITLVTLVALGAIIFFWQLFERHHRRLWHACYALWKNVSDTKAVSNLWKINPSLWKFLGRRLSSQGYLILHLLIGFIITYLAFTTFGGLADQVVESEGVVHFDQDLATALHENANDFQSTLFRVITDFGGRIATIVIGLGVGLWLLLRKHKILLVSWAVAILGSSLLNAVLKLAYQRSRPTFENPLLVETFYSFPSGHAMGSVIIYGMLAYILNVLFADTAWKRVVLICITAWFILFIGFSRMYLGVHYFSDVVGGYIAGIGWLAIVVTGTEIARRQSKKETSSPEEVPSYTPAQDRP
ncbi:MAG: phosphatase PAP2 family protein [Anaerolineae bacterium]|nr:phosphatase PAP2 family protein [Anaerolineae bacterium]